MSNEQTPQGVSDDTHSSRQVVDCAAQAGSICESRSRRHSSRKLTKLPHQLERVGSREGGVVLVLVRCPRVVLVVDDVTGQAKGGPHRRRLRILLQLPSEWSSESAQTATSSE